MSTTVPSTPTTSQLIDMTVRDLTERFPETMSVLAPIGIDLCCGGAHRLGDALVLHGADVEGTLAALKQTIARDTNGA